MSHMPSADDLPTTTTPDRRLDYVPPRHGGNIAVGYLRRSTDRQEQSIPDQQRAIEQYAAEHGFTIARFYIDDAISGTSTVGRRAFQQMIGDAQQPPSARCFDTVIVYDVKRFGRVDNDEAGYYRHLLRINGVEVRYVSENFNGDGTDDLLRPVKQWQARQESKDLSKVTIRGLLSKSESGYWMGGVPPYGYDLRYESSLGQFLFRLRYQRDGTKQMLEDAADGKVTRILQRDERIAVSRKDRCKLVPSDPERVEIIRRIFRMYTADKKGLKAVADQLNRKGIPPARGPTWAKHYSGRWSMTTVRSILLNPAYAGDMAWNRHTDARFYKINNGSAVERADAYGRRLARNDEQHWIVVRDAHPALVSRRVSQTARELLSQKPTSAAQRGLNQRTGNPAGPAQPRGGWVGPRARFLLSGLLRCAHCNSRYEGYTQRSRKVRSDGNRTKRFCYACGGYIRNGASACELGEVPQEPLERAVVDAVVAYYGRLGSADRKDAIAQVLHKQMGSELRENQKVQAQLQQRLGRLEGTFRNLLDNMTAANRDHVDRRIVELSAEREQVQQQIAQLERRCLSDAELETVVRELVRFLALLGAALREGGDLGDRQAALRRCVERATIDRAAREVRIDVRALPVVPGGPETVPTERLRIPLPAAAAPPPGDRGGGVRLRKAQIPTSPARPRTGASGVLRPHGAAAESVLGLSKGEVTMSKKQKPSATKAKGREAAREAPATTPKKSGTRKPQLSCLDAAVEVLKAERKPLNCRSMIELMFKRKLWQSDAPTPAATLSSAILREIVKRGARSRFVKSAPGLFGPTKHAREAASA